MDLRLLAGMGTTAKVLQALEVCFAEKNLRQYWMLLLTALYERERERLHE